VSHHQYIEDNNRWDDVKGEVLWQDMEVEKNSSYYKSWKILNKGLFLEHCAEIGAAGQRFISKKQAYSSFRLPKFNGEPVDR